MNSKLGYLIKCIQHQMRRQMDVDLLEVGLSSSQYAALAAIEANSSISNASLAKLCFVTAQSMIGVSANLENLGLIKRSDSSDGSRVRPINLTKQGKVILRRAHEIAEGIENWLMKDFSKSEKTAMSSFLARCLQNVDDSVIG